MENGPRVIIWLAWLFLLSIPIALALLDSGLRLAYLWVARREAGGASPGLEPDSPAPTSRLAVLIVARNEAALIRDTIAGVQRILDPRSSTIFVLADHCSDETARLAEAAGVQVFSRQEGAPGKGPALAWLATCARDALRDFDAVAILDADSRLQEGFGKAVQRRLAGGADAIQAFVQPLLTNGAARGSLAAYSELLSEVVDDAARMSLGWPVQLRGTGMILRTDLFLELTPRLGTQVEDIELSLLLADEGVRVVLAPEAVVLDPKPAGVPGLARQRGRWLYGQRQVWRNYAPEIARLVRRGPAGWALIQALLLKPKTLSLGLKCGLAAAAWWIPLGPPALRIALGALSATAVCADLIYYALGLFFVSQPGFFFRALLRSPVYFLVWIRALKYSLTAGGAWMRAREG